MRRSSGGGSSTVLRRLGRHADFLGSLPPDDGDGLLDGVPPEDRAALAELILHAMAIECSRLESLGVLSWPSGDDERIARVAAEVHARAVRHVDLGGSLDELQDRLDGLRRVTWRWARPLPPGPGDDPDDIPVRRGGTPDGAPTDQRWLVDGLFPDAT
jgi:hypothetical protein